MEHLLEYEDFLNESKRLKNGKEVSELIQPIVKKYGYTSFVTGSNPYKVSFSEDVDDKKFDIQISEIKEKDDIIQEIKDKGYDASIGTDGPRPFKYLLIK